MVGELHEIEQAMRAAGYSLASNDVHCAALSLRGAVDHAPMPDWPEGSSAEIVDGEPVRTFDGRKTGFILVPVAGGGGRLAAVEGRRGAHPLTVPPAHDLAWDLLASDAAARFAANAPHAALLAHALSSTGWFSSARRARWATSPLGAMTIVRLLRRGSAVAALSPATSLLSVEVLELIEGLGWQPELRR
jgi:hypothetical protein